VTVTSRASKVELELVGDLRVIAMSAGLRSGCAGKRFVGSKRTSNLLCTRPDKGARVASRVYMVFRIALCRGVLEYLHEKRWSP
jgi:hypothetical protein